MLTRARQCMNNGELFLAEHEDGVVYFKEFLDAHKAALNALRLSFSGVVKAKESGDATELKRALLEHMRLSSLFDEGFDTIRLVESGLKEKWLAWKPSTLQFQNLKRSSR